MRSADAVSPRRTGWPGWRRAPWPERRAFVAGLVLLPLIALSLRLVGVRRTIAWTARGRELTASPADEAALVSAAVTAIRRAERHGLIEGTCLSRSLALRFMLARAGITTDLKFGARRQAGRFEAHAWLERGGLPIADAPDPGRPFVPFATTPAPSGPQPGDRPPS
jgi:Transglutaminase-like superfamily